MSSTQQCGTVRLDPPGPLEDYPRRACPRCGRMTRVNKYGTLAPHAPELATKVAPTGFAVPAWEKAHQAAAELAACVVAAVAPRDERMRAFVDGRVRGLAFRWAELVEEAIEDNARFLATLTGRAA